MNTRDLAYFQALTKIHSFSQVANKFQVTQPTISMAVKRLETHFGTQLIERDQSHGMIQLTAAGEQLAAHVQVIIAELTAAEAELARAQAPQLRLGLPPIIGNFYFPQLAPQLVAAGLMPLLQTIEAGSATLLKDLQAGALDLALLGATGPITTPGLTITPLQEVPFTLVVPPDHPLAGRSEVSLAEVATAPFIALTAGFVHPEAVAWFSSQAHTPLQVVYQTADVTLLKRMVQSHVGLAILAAIAVTPADHLVTIPLVGPAQPAFEISLATPTSLSATPPVATLRRLLTATAKGAQNAH